jgi:ABC-type sugar transport system ATPase subunit/ribose/xylose/arabinose/galactoside ABC-type transport system permease subunit
MTDALTITCVSKAFPGVQALDGVSLAVRRGEIHAIVGENGAGKSTLMKILAGALVPDAGEVLVHGERLSAFTPEISRAHGIAIIFQEFNLVPHLSVAENISLGREPATGGWLRRTEERRRARDLLALLETSIRPRTPVRRLSVAKQQLVEIAKALSLDASFLIMDEPASALSIAEREHLFALIGKLRERGITIVYVSHHLEEVFRLADQVTVLKDGRLVRTMPVAETDRESLVTLMVGRKLAQVFPPKASHVGDEALGVRSLRSGSEVRDVSFTLRRGEITGLYGLVGAGRTELAKALFGARPHRGEVALFGRRVSFRRPSAAVKRGVALLTEDRKKEGLVMGLSVRENVALPSLDRRASFGVVQRAREREAVAGLVERLSIRTPTTENAVLALSGGNQQKVVIGKWLLAEPSVLICDEPTRGVDVGAKSEIYSHLRDLAEQGLAILMISSELPEVLGMSDRVLVMREGQIVAELGSREATEEAVMRAALSGKAAESQEEIAEEAPERWGRGLLSWLGALRGRRPNATAIAVTALFALLLAGVVSSPDFLGAYNLTSILRDAVALGLVAIGQAMVMIAGGVDLSVGSTITLTTILSAGLMAGSDGMILPAAAGALLVALVVGTLNGIAVVWLRVAPFIATLSVMSITRGIVLLITHGTIGSIGKGFRSLSRGSVGPLPSALFIIVGVFVLAWAVMNRTRYGRHLFALGGNREVARLAGVRVRTLEFSSYLVSGGCAALAGLYLTSRMGAGDPSVGPGFELNSIIAVLIGGIPFGGGRGNVVGVIAGVLLLAVLGNLLNLWNLSSWYHQIARALVLLVAIALFKKED